MEAKDRPASSAPSRTPNTDLSDEEWASANKNPDYLELHNQLQEAYERKVEQSELRKQCETASIRHWCRVERQQAENTFNNATKEARQNMRQEILDKIALLEAEMEALKEMQQQ